MSNMVVSYKRQELLTLREHLCSPAFFWWGPFCSSYKFSVLCCVYFLCIWLSVVCAQCYLCLWIVHSWLPLQFSLTFICPVSCVPYVVCVSRLYILDYPFSFLKRCILKFKKMICLNNSNTNIVKVGLFYINATKNISFFSSFGTNKLTLVQGPLIGHGGLTEFPIRTKNLNCVEAHPLNLPVMFVFNWPSGFREID